MIFKSHATNVYSNLKNKKGLNERWDRILANPGIETLCSTVGLECWLLEISQYFVDGNITDFLCACLEWYCTMNLGTETPKSSSWVKMAHLESN